MSESFGRKIAVITFANSPPHIDPSVSSTAERSLHWHEDNHGTHDIAWIVQMQDGVEIARFNPRYIESIVWAPGDKT